MIDIIPIKKAIVDMLMQQDDLYVNWDGFGKYRGGNITIEGEVDLTLVINICLKAVEVQALKELAEATQLIEQIRTLRAGEAIKI